MPDPEFSVVMNDLLTAADAFQQQSGVLSQMMPSDGPQPVPSGGDTAIDNAMHQAAQLLGELHSQLATAISRHGTDLQDAHDKYYKTETQLGQVASELIKIISPSTI
jgi:4-aminobutyrate aminotransferase-like enzyme